MQSPLPPSVLVIGAGPAGLVTAKTLLHTPSTSHFRLTLLDQEPRVGGAWGVGPPTSPRDDACPSALEEERDDVCSVDGRPGRKPWKLNPEMRTNLSRFTVCFPDFSWQSALRDGDAKEEGKDREHAEAEDQGTTRLPLFPQAWQVGRYLEAYARRYIPNGVLELGCRVTAAELVNVDEQRQKQDGIDGQTSGQAARRRIWRVRWEKRDGERDGERDGRVEEREELFDYLVIATGFFHSPRRPTFDIEREQEDSPPVVHSHDFKSAVELLRSSPHPQTGNTTTASAQEPGTLLVVGSSMSALEAASIAASQLSSSLHSPPSATRPSSPGLRLSDRITHITHVLPHPQYSVPAYLPDPRHMHEPAPTFLPLDLALYDLSRRPPGPINASYGLVSAEAAHATHEYLRAALGWKDGHELGAHGAALVAAPAELAEPPRVGIEVLGRGMGGYAGFVQSGLVRTRRGRLMRVAGGGRVVLEGGETVEGVRGVVWAGGWEAMAGLKWLRDEGVRARLGLDSEHGATERARRLPVRLGREVVWPADRELQKCMAFVGYYEGPYWGVMAMQARLLARRLGQCATPGEEGGNASGSGAGPEEDQNDEETAFQLRMQALGEALDRRDPRVPQFWNGDYVGLMEQFGRALGILRRGGGREGPVVPARYVLPGCEDLTEADAALADLAGLLAASQRGRFLPRAIWRGLQGRWHLRRKVDSRLPALPSGVFEGCAEFHPRAPTGSAWDGEYLYVEQGLFATDAGLQLPARQRYVYRYSEEKEQVTVWFTKEDGLTVDYLFHEVIVRERDENGDEQGWFGRGHHLCVRDTYDATYRFCFQGALLERLEIRHDVKGPKKDYISRSWYAKG